MSIPPGSTIQNDGSLWNALFSPLSMAVIGANETMGSWGSDAIRAALAAAKTNPKRRAYAVNPNQKQVMGTAAYSSILDIADSVDLATIAVRADLVPGVLRQCVQKGVKAAVIISAGFAETDEAGARLEKEVVEIARQGGIRFIGPNCIGYSDMYTNVSTLGASGWGRPGPMALLSQSGTISASIMQGAASRGIGLSKFISTGNEADLHIEDFVEYLAGDDNTRIICAYVEGLREGRRFFRLAKATTVKKPIVMIKTGSTEGATQAARSHTGALAGSSTVFSAVFRQTGVVRVDDEEELCDVALALLCQPLPRGNRVGILTIGGGFGVMAAEACESEGLKMASLQAETLSKLDAVLPPRWSHGNPVDMVGVKTIDESAMILACLRALIEDSNVDAVVALVALRNYGGSDFQAAQANSERTLKELGQLSRQLGKPLLLVRRSPPQPMRNGEPPALSYEGKIPEYAHPRRAARVLGHVMRYSRYVNGDASR